VFCEKEFGVEYDSEVPDVWTPRGGSMLKLKWDRGSKATVCE
jgi:hypothetical protein